MPLGTPFPEGYERQNGPHGHSVVCAVGGEGEVLAVHDGMASVTP